MPTLKQVTCSVAIGSNNTRLKEYRHRFTDGAVEAYIPVPDADDQSFSVLVESDGYIAPGLAVYIFIDGVYQVNRNKLDLQPTDDSLRNCEIKFKFRQQEEIMPDGSMIARPWSFAELPRTRITSGYSGLHANLGESIGTIEIVVLRCSIPMANTLRGTLTPPSSHSCREVSRSRIFSISGSKISKSKAPVSKASRPVTANHTSIHPSESGGLFGLFDGAGDEYPPRSHRPHDWRRTRHRSYEDYPLRSHPETKYTSSEDSHRFHSIRYPRTYRTASLDEKPFTRVQSYSQSPAVYPTRTLRRRDQASSRIADTTGLTFTEPTSDELDRLIFLHKQLRINNAQSQEVRKAKDLFERTLKDKSNPYVQQLSSQRLGELERQLQEIETRRNTDTEFIFECLVDMNKVQLMFASGVLRDKDIALPSFEVIQEWQKRRSNQVKVELPLEIDTEQADKKDTFEPVGKGVADDWNQVGEGVANSNEDAPNGNIGWQQVGEGVISGSKGGQGANESNQWNNPAKEHQDLAADNKDNDQSGDIWGGNKYAEQKDSNWEDNQAADQNNNWENDHAADQNNSWEDNQTPDQNNDWGNDQDACQSNGWDDNQHADQNNGWGNVEDADQNNDRASIQSNHQSAGHGKDFNEKHHRNDSRTKSTGTQASARQNRTSGWKGQSNRSYGKINADDFSKEFQAHQPRSKMYFKTTSHASSVPASLYTNAGEPRREIKPYWSSVRRDALTNDHDGHSYEGHQREPYEFPARLSLMSPAGIPKEVSHGMHIGKGSAYKHTNTEPEYMDSMSNPYAVFVFRYRSREALEKTLGRKLSPEGNDTKERPGREDLMRLPKDELVRKLLKSEQKDESRRMVSRSRKSHVSRSRSLRSEVKPDDSVSQITSNNNSTVVRSKYHRSSHAADSNRETSRTVKSMGRKSDWGERSGNVWGGNDQNAWACDNGDAWNQQEKSRSSKSAKSSEKTFEHFPGEKLEATGGAAW